MAGLNTQIIADTGFVDRYANWPKLVDRASRRALTKTNNWLRTATMAELGYELGINTKNMRRRFRNYKAGSLARLWIGLNDISVHRLGKPEQTKSGVRVGDHFFEKAFISPMNTSELLVWRRTGGQNSKLEMVRLDIKEEAQEILGSYAIEINEKFRGFFDVEIKRLLSA